MLQIPKRKHKLNSLNNTWEKKYLKAIQFYLIHKQNMNEFYKRDYPLSKF